MRTSGTIIKDEQSAAEYDLRARETNWLGPEVIFGLTYELVRPGDSILDLGIGSGLSSTLFHKAGLRVYGLDGSSEVLDVCRSKGFTVELKQYDLRDTPLPYSSGSFDHLVCVAVLNSFKDLGPLFAEIARIVKETGSFAFTVEERQPDQDGEYAINRVDVSEKPKAEEAVTLYRHGANDIARLLGDNGFVLLKALKFLAFKYPAENRDIYFTAYVAQKSRSSQ
jgi:ubiquinone/menaquinone biosynthesis C-methylase UbiE